MNDLWTILSVSAAWTMVLGGLIKYLYDKNESHRNKELTEIKGQIGLLRNESLAYQGTTRSEHREIHTQVGGLMRDIAENYVRKGDLKDHLEAIQGEISETRKDVGKVHERVDDIYRGFLSSQTAHRRNS